MIDNNTFFSTEATNQLDSIKQENKFMIKIDTNLKLQKGT